MKTYPFLIDPGIQKDGTPFSSRRWSDGNWSRFQRNLPRKMGGFQQIMSTGTGNIPRGCFSTPVGNNIRGFYGTASGLNYFVYSREKQILANPRAITPNLYGGSPDSLWNFGVMNIADISQEQGGYSRNLIAHAGYNLSDINSDVELPVYTGTIPDDVAENITLNPIQGGSASGGISILYPYLFVFGNNGIVKWSEAGNPEVFPDENFLQISGEKIVASMRVRGGNYSPSGLFWSTSEVIKSFYIGEANRPFGFDTVSSQSSILSSNSIISIDGLYFWPGNERFMFYNGNVQFLPNDTNINFFYKNLNFNYRQKIWGTYIPRFNELVWFFPFGDSTENNHMLIFNKDLNIWYNTPIPYLETEPNEWYRTCGYYDNFAGSPMWFSPTQLYLHETGVDNVNSIGQNRKIRSSIKSSDISFCAVDSAKMFKGIDSQVELKRIEPDFNLTGNMQVNVYGKSFASQADELLSTRTINSQTKLLTYKLQKRQMSIEFVSDEVGGDYEMGSILIGMTVGDNRPEV